MSELERALERREKAHAAEIAECNQEIAERDDMIDKLILAVKTAYEDCCDEYYNNVLKEVREMRKLGRE